ncbi:MAG: sulfite exporter TauE/SafE family protein [Spirochaetaceae bacterium]|nr:sulfite exporter TauE/SafE family protein [Spirochaetaceae bacterium]
MAAGLIWGVALALVVGVIMGLAGAGGSILTVPILVYVVGVDAVTATAYSLFVVGVTSVVGAASHWRRGQVNVRAAVAFSIPSLVVVFFTRSLLVPAIPAQLGTVAGVAVSKDLFILVLFAVIMALAALSMIVKPRYRISLAETPAAEEDSGAAARQPAAPVKVSIPLAALEGTVIGVFTGVVGAGGGFAIVPALVVLSRLPMRVAVGTSLTIIAAKSLAGFVGDITLQGDFDWGLLLAFTGLAVVGILAGSRIGHHVPGARLRPAFGWFVLVAAAGILVRELLLG